MIDEGFIETVSQRGKVAKEKVQSEFSSISLQQVNWKPIPEGVLLNAGTPCHIS